MKVELSKELREVFEQLIPIYEKAVEEFPETKWGFYLSINYLDEGICYASNHILDKLIDKQMKKISKKLGLQTFWYNPPILIETRTEAIDCLQWRINKMKELLNQN